MLPASFGPVRGSPGHPRVKPEDEDDDREGGAKVPKASGGEDAIAKRRTHEISHFLLRPISPTPEFSPQLTLCHLLSLWSRASVIMSGDRTE